jgi:NTE family protein
MTTLRQWLSERPFALGMSSGFFAFFAHSGVLSVLDREGLTPVRGSGSSAGALVLGLWAGGMGPGQIADELRRLERADFWDPGPGAGLLRGRLFRRRLEALLQVQSFEQARIPLAFSAYDVLGLRTRVLEQGPLARAICASCAVPGLFHPVWIDGRPFVDGGVADRPGLAGMPPGTRLLFHHIANRSPWRRRGGSAMRVPRRPGMVTLVIDGLPRVHPFALRRGSQAYELARRATETALDLPIDAGQVRLRA